MNVTVGGLKEREADDPAYADYWLLLQHISGVEWEVPVTKAELTGMLPWIPKEIKALLNERK
jgi:hypothetical protein